MFQRAPGLENSTPHLERDDNNTVFNCVTPQMHIDGLLIFKRNRNDCGKHRDS